MKKTLSLLTLSLLTACSSLPSWVGGEEEEVRLEGKRLSVLSFRSDLTADKNAQKIPLNLPSPVKNVSWSGKDKAPAPHLAFTLNGKKKTVDIGQKPKKNVAMLAPPVAGNGLLFTLDGRGGVRAASIKNPSKTQWTYDIETGETERGVFGVELGLGRSKKPFIGGYITYHKGIVYITTHTGKLIALDSKTGKQKLFKRFSLPLQSPATVSDKVLYVVTTENQLLAIDLKSSELDVLWRHDGFKEVTTLIGSPAPYVFQNILLVPYSSGEIFALNRDTGEALWASNLGSTRKRDISQFSFNDIDATPVVANNIVYTIGNEGLLSAIDVFKGRTYWQQEISGNRTPWVVADHVFVISKSNELVAINATTGRIRWVQSLPDYTDKKIIGDDEVIKANWHGPVVAGGTVWVASSEGELVGLRPEDGAFRMRKKMFDEPSFAPIVVDGRMFMLNQKAKLTVVD